jgi:hypothetical protein
MYYVIHPKYIFSEPYCHVHPSYMAGWVRLEMTHENPSRRMTKVLPSIFNITIDMSYAIHPKYILSDHFFNVS